MNKETINMDVFTSVFATSCLLWYIFHEYTSSKYIMQLSHSYLVIIGLLYGLINENYSCMDIICVISCGYFLIDCRNNQKKYIAHHVLAIIVLLFVINDEDVKTIAYLGYIIIEMGNVFLYTAGLVFSKINLSKNSRKFILLTELCGFLFFRVIIVFYLYFGMEIKYVLMCVPFHFMSIYWSMKLILQFLDIV